MMNSKNRLKLLGLLFLSLTVASITGCSKDDENPGDPTGTITLNMLNEQNGKTLLGTSDVYINKSNNFSMSTCVISDAGNASGVGVRITPELTNLSREVAVVPGHVYQIFKKAAILDFPSGNRALSIAADYYQLYVVSSITGDNAVTGATVKYFLAYPDGGALPKVDHKIGNFYHPGETLEMALPRGAECVLKERNYEDVEDVLEMSTDNNKLKITLKQEPNHVSGAWGKYYIYIRLGNVYTSVFVGVGNFN